MWRHPLRLCFVLEMQRRVEVGHALVDPLPSVGLLAVLLLQCLYVHNQLTGAAV